MPVPQNPGGNSSRTDISLRAQHELDAMIDSREGHEDIVVLDEVLQARIDAPPVIEEVVPSEEPLQPERQSISPDEARAEAPVLDVNSGRDAVRLLIFTKNMNVRILGSLSQKRLLELSKVFAEIHVVILSLEEEESVPTVRIADNVWLYHTESTSWWRTALDGYRIANEQLVFAGGFRADTIVAEDPFESAFAAHFIAKKYERPLQIHILEDIYADEFKERDEHNALRLFLSK